LISIQVSDPPPILKQPVTLVRGVGPATAATLAELGITTIDRLAEAAPTGTAAIDVAIGRARAVKQGAQAVQRELVQARPSIADVDAFMGLRLADVNQSVLTTAGLAPATATAVLAAFAAIVDNTTQPGLTIGDALSGAPVLAAT
jgi:predicted RecB family nuclease